MAGFKIAIPSRNRASAVAKTLAFMEATGAEVTVFVNGPQDAATYAKANPSSKARFVDLECAKGITPARNAILAHYKPGDRVVMSDDDVDALKGAMRNRYTPEQVAAMCVANFDFCEKQGWKLWGVYPKDDERCMSGGRYGADKPLYSKAAFVIGTFMGVIVSELRFDEQFTTKEDFDFTLQHIYAHGGVLRRNDVAVDAKHWTNPGGCVDYRTDGIEKDMVARLKAKWGEAVRSHSAKPDTEVIINSAPFR